MEDENEESAIPECPYCEDPSGDCEHVLLNYDASFMEYLSGYLAEDREQIETLKQSIYELIKSNKSPELDEGYLNDIWEYAVDNYDPNSQEIDLDTTAYFNLVDEIIHLHGGESFHYEESDGAPGFSSAYIIFFAKDPEQTIKQINEYIMEELNS